MARKEYLENNRVKQLATDLSAYEKQQPDKWSGGTYGKSVDAALQKILKRDKFQYDVNGDALYQQYKDRYMQQGKQAMMDTMGQAAALTGGYGNSYAQQVGQQTYQGYLQGLDDKVPELYKLALDRYNQEGTDLMNRYSLLADRSDKEYNRYRDSVSDWQTQRDYLTNRYNNERNFDEALRQYNENLVEQKRQYDATMAENKRQFDAQMAYKASSGGSSGSGGGSGSSGSSGSGRNGVTVSRNGAPESARGGGTTRFANIQQTIRGHMMTGHPEKAEQLIAEVWSQLDENQKKDIENMGFKIG